MQDDYEYKKEWRRKRVIEMELTTVAKSAIRDTLSYFNKCNAKAYDGEMPCDCCNSTATVTDGEMYLCQNHAQEA